MTIGASERVTSAEFRVDGPGDVERLLHSLNAHADNRRA